MSISIGTLTKSLLFSVFALLIVSCSQQNQSKVQSGEIEAFLIDSLYAFSDFETHNIAQPSVLKFVDDRGLYISDFAQKTISLVNEGGELINTFGRAGRGPGEFMNPAFLESTPEVFLVTDNREYKISRFDYDGNFLNSYPFSTQDLSRTVELIEDSVYVSGTNSQSDSLLQLTNLKTDTTFTFGVPKDAKFSGVDLDQSRNQMKRGEIPDFMKNFIRIQSDDSHIYVYFNSYSELHKYTIEGKFLWKKELNLPYNEELFEQTVERAKTSDTSGGEVHIFSFIYGFDVYNTEIYLLTPPINEKPQLLVKFNSAGEMKTIYTLPNSDDLLMNFSIDTSSSTAYFSSFQSGLVYKAKLPPS